MRVYCNLNLQYAETDEYRMERRLMILRFDPETQEEIADSLDRDGTNEDIAHKRKIKDIPVDVIKAFRKRVRATGL